MRKRIAAAAAAGALVLAGGTAIADPGGPFGLGGDPKEEKADFARDLASKLDGVSPQQVERALDQVHSDRRAEHRSELAQALAGELEGVSQEEAETALEKSEAAMSHAFRGGDRPAGPPHETLPRELGVSQAELEKAFRAIHEKRMEERGAPRGELRFRHGPGPHDHVRPAPHPPGGGHGFVLPAPPPPPR